MKPQHRLYRDAQNDYWEARSRRARHTLAFRRYARRVLLGAVIAALVGGGIAIAMRRPGHTSLTNQAATARATASTSPGASASPRPMSTADQPPAAEPGVATYLCSFNNEYMLLQWNTANGAMSGTYQDAQLTGGAPDEQVISRSGSFGGAINGPGITLNFAARTWYGTMNASSVTLNVPRSDGSIQSVTCDQSDVTGWNSAVSDLNQEATSDNNAANAAAAVQQAQESLASDISSLTSDSTTLNTDTSLSEDITAMQNDYATEQQDWQTEQSDTCASLGSDWSTVNSDATTVNNDLDGLNNAIQSLQQGDIASVKTDLSNVQSDLNNLSSLGATPGVSTSAAITEGNQALNSAASAISWAQGKGATINSEAQQLETTAQNYADQHQCLVTGAPA